MFYVDICAPCLWAKRAREDDERKAADDERRTGEAAQVQLAQELVRQFADAVRRGHQPLAPIYRRWHKKRRGAPVAWGWPLSGGTGPGLYLLDDRRRIAKTSFDGHVHTWRASHVVLDYIEDSMSVETARCVVKIVAPKDAPI